MLKFMYLSSVHVNVKHLEIISKSLDSFIHLSIQYKRFNMLEEFYVKHLWLKTQKKYTHFPDTERKGSHTIGQLPSTSIAENCPAL